MRLAFLLLIAFTATIQTDSGTMREQPTDPYGKAVLADQPVSYHRFNETTGTTAADATGRGHDAVYKGDIKLGEPSAYPALGMAALFDGKSTRVQIPSHADFKFGKGDFSIECWFSCRESLSTRGDILKYKGEGKDLGIFKPVGNNNLLTVARPGRQFQAQTDPFAVGVWHHVVYVRRAGVDMWYVDGAPSGTATGHNLNIDMNVDLLIGADHDGNPNDIVSAFVWNGLIDELAFYNQALTAQQIAKHYKAAQQKP
jgi:hypothetical protein